MKSITIHNLDEPLNSLLRRKAKSQGTSLNKTIKSLLESSLGIQSQEPADRRSDFADLCGIWTEKEAQVFFLTQEDMETIDSEDWR
ncbi:MAG: hypothetical protein GY868_04145 [Deltaproteobacteria bacterium]|nr:hypothetical protein [Deltaproteobacteria bacterium]